MDELQKPKVKTNPDMLAPNTTGPLVFISHDARDAELAEAFGKLLKSVSSGTIKSFRSSDKKGDEGIAYGEEWYTRLMERLQSTSDVVCLFTERSLDRPWILFEAGVAKAKLGTPVIGIALGVPRGRVNAGPFYHFHNCGDSVEELSKLLNQIAERVPNVELDADVVKAQVQAFKTSEGTILKSLAATGKKSGPDDAGESLVAKLAEEIKALPSRVAERLAEGGDQFRRRRTRRIHPMMLEELMHMSNEPGDPVGILMAASLMREDAPWLYELAMEVYRAAKSGDSDAIQREVARLKRFSDLMMRGPFMEELGMGGKDSHIFMMEFPRMLEHMLRHTLDVKNAHPRRRQQKPQADLSGAPET